MQQDMQKCTNYGEDYNRESMYETVRDVLLTGKKVRVGHRKYDSLIKVMLRDAELEEKRADKAWKDLQNPSKTNKGNNDYLLRLMASKGKVTGSRLRERVDKVNNVVYKLSMFTIETMPMLAVTLNNISKGEIVDDETLQAIIDILKDMENQYLECMFDDCVDTKSKDIYHHVKITRANFEDILNQQLNK